MERKAPFNGNRSSAVLAAGNASLGAILELLESLAELLQAILVHLATIELVDSKLDIVVKLPLLDFDFSQHPDGIHNQLLLRLILAQGELLFHELTKFGR
jgi:hypothetical protein